MKSDLGLLLLRLGFGGIMLFSHGLPKLMGFAESSATFADPIGVGPAASLGMAVFAEVLCSLAVILGLFTRATVIPLLVTMGVAALIVHADDPWQKKEMAVLFALGFGALLLSGPGRFSVDGYRRARS